MQDIVDNFKKFASTFSNAKEAIKFLETHNNFETMEYLNTIGFNNISEIFVDQIRIGVVNFMNQQVIQYGVLNLNAPVICEERLRSKELSKDLSSSYNK